MTRKLKVPGYSIASHRRGNTTSGPERRGNRNGRAPIYPPGTGTWQILLKLSDEHFAKAIYAGDGNASSGIRKLLSAYQAPEGASLERVKAEGIARAKAEERRRAARKSNARAVRFAKLDAAINAGPRPSEEDKRLAEQASNEWDDIS